MNSNLDPLLPEQKVDTFDSAKLPDLHETLVKMVALKAANIRYVLMKFWYLVIVSGQQYRTAKQSNNRHQNRLDAAVFVFEIQKTVFPQAVLTSIICGATKQ